MTSSNSICVQWVPLVTGERGEPLKAYLHHLKRFLGLVQGDGLCALLLDVHFQMILQVTANTCVKEKYMKRH